MGREAPDQGPDEEPDEEKGARSMEAEPYLVRFEPMGVACAVSRGTRVYDVAQALGLPLAQSCGGEGICGRCGIRAMAGAEHLSPERRPETHRKASNRIDPTLRLACLTTIRGPVVLTTDYW